MKNLSAILLASLSLFSCKSDQDHQDEFAGTYEVSIELPDTKKEMKKAKKEIGQEMENAKKEIETSIEDAKRDIEAEFGEDSDLGKAISSFVEGMGHLANSMTGLGESLGELGIDLSTDILSSVSFTAEFQRDGEVVFGKNRGVRFRGDDLRWKYKDGNILMWNKSEREKDADVFQVKKMAANEYDLIGDEVIFHLIKE